MVLLGVVVVLTFIAGGIGLTMLWVPESYSASRAFSVAFDQGPPVHVWGASLLAIAACTLIAIPGGRRGVLAVAIGGQSIVWSLWGLALIAGVRNGAPSGAIVYTGVSWVCMFLATYYWLTRDAGKVTP